MSKETDVTLWMATDQDLVFQILSEDESAAVDISAYDLSFMVKADPLLDADAAALVTKTVTGTGIVVDGAFNTDPDVNAQRATVSLVVADFEGIAPGVSRYELKRIDSGFETILAFGVLRLRRGVHRA